MPKQTSKADRQQSKPKADPVVVQPETEQPTEPKEQTATKPKYTVPKGEENLYHVELSKNVFDPSTGKPVFKPFVQKYNIKMWNTIVDYLKRDGYTLNILHSPTKK